MAENNSSAPLKTAEGAATLWCVHVTGADDVHPMPSREVALEEANALNTSICRIKRQDIDPVLIAVVAEWPHSADSHAAGLAIRDECLRMRGGLAAVEAQAAPVAVAYGDGFMEAINEMDGLYETEPLATPALPATEDSSAGDLAEVQAEPVSSDPVAWHSKLYGTCWMHKQPYHLDAGTHFFVRGNPNPVATVLSGAAIQWHTGTAAFEHGTFFYTAPQAQPADALDAETIKKAARYEWLRAQGMLLDGSGHPNFWRCMALLGGTFSCGENADDTIDAAMAAAQEGGQ
ncbi:hypothetical protein [Comamonas sp. MYb69]|uniref:hypothetical protein n=1 Tax=Comamonas sp. MYb69 TaxID=1848650 RepID=UPI0030A69878